MAQCLERADVWSRTFDLLGPDRVTFAQLLERLAARSGARPRIVHLPPGLAERDELPPGLERQLVVRGTLPPGLRSRMHLCPVEVERYLPPPPVGYMHTVIGGHIALVNRKTFLVLDVFRFEM